MQFSNTIESCLSLTCSFFRLLCALEGNYLVTEANDEVEHVDGVNKYAKLQSMDLTCSIPAVSGRGFIEVNSCPKFVLVPLLT